MSTRIQPLLRLAAACFVLLPLAAHAAGHPPPLQYTPYCAGTIGVDYAWPAHSDSPAVEKFRDQIVYAIKSFYSFEYDEYTLPEEVVQIGDPPRTMMLPQGWVLAMDAYPGGYSTAVAIPPKDGPFADEAGLSALLERKKAIFGAGGYITVPAGRGDLTHGVRLPCSPNDPSNRAPAIALDIPFQG